MNWFKEYPQKPGEYLYVTYWDCCCCIFIIGYVWITPPLEGVDKKSPFTYNYVTNEGIELQMHFEGNGKDSLPTKNDKGELYVDAWCEYTPPDRNLLDKWADSWE